MSAYEVRFNSCGCHPETCCCNDWAIFSTDGKKHSTHFTRQLADQIAAALNMAAPSSAAGKKGGKA